MAISLPALVQRVQLDASGVRRGASEIQRSEGTVKKSFGGIGKAAALLTTAVGGLALGKFIKDSVTEARESIRVGKLTAQVIKTTGGSARVTAKHVGTLATKISNLSGIDDEAVQAGANLLLTFTNIRNEVGKGNNIFDQATSIITDMSAALGTDLKGSAIQVGKALNDPVKGVTALQRVGVSFTAQQKEQIKVMVASGRTLDAQKLILGELSKEFGGAAEASADPMQKLGVIFKNLEETVGTALLPALNKGATFLGDKFVPLVTKALSFAGKFFHALGEGFKGRGLDAGGILGVASTVGDAIRGLVDYVRTQLVPVFTENWPKVVGAFDDARAAFAPFAKTIGDFIRTHPEVVLAAVGASLAAFGGLKTASIISGVTSSLGALLPMLASLGAPGLIVAGIAALAAAFVVLFQRNEDFRNGVLNTLDALNTRFGPFLQTFVQGIVAQFDQLVEFVRKNMDSFQEAIGHVLVAVQAFWHQFGDEIMLVVRNAFTFVKEVVSSFMLIIRGIIQIVTGLINGDWSKAWQGVKDIFAGEWRFILAILRQALGTIEAIITATLGAVRRVWEIGWNALTAVVGNVFGKVRSVVLTGIADVVSFFDGFKGTIGAVLEGVADAILSPFKIAFNAIALLWNNTVGKLSFKIPGWVPGIGGKGFDVPDIPTFAKGGVVPGAFGSPQLILAHGGETVIGLDEMRRLIRERVGGAPASGAPPALAREGDTFNIGPIVTPSFDLAEFERLKRRSSLLQRRVVG